MNNMIELKRRFDLPVGFSDHTTISETSLAAVSMGATIIEKHVTLDRNLPGPDHKSSSTIKITLKKYTLDNISFIKNL